MIRVVLLAFVLASRAPTSWANVERARFENASRKLVVEILDDELIHLEYSNRDGNGDTSAAIATSPEIQKTDYPGPHHFQAHATTLETASARLEVDPSSLCIRLTDLARATFLTTICNSQGLTLARGEMQNAYGLGEQFTEPGQANGDWIGKERTPGSKYGNSLPEFQGGYTGNAQFPILYALGKRLENYALFLDHTPVMRWNFKGDPWTVRTDDASLRFYLILGKDLPALRHQYMDLVGHPALPPKQALGLWVSEFGYRNWSEIDDKLKTLRQNHFPIDGFVLDAFWFGGFEPFSPDSKVGSLTWDESAFSSHAQRIAAYDRKEGLGIAAIEESYVSSGLREYSLLQNHGFLVRTCATCAPAAEDEWWGKGGMIDWTNDEAADFWHDLKRQPLIDEGIALHWTDLGEPEVFGDQDWFKGDLPGVRGHGEKEFHNLFNFKWAESIARGYARHRVSRRPFILSRSGAPGIQRFGLAMWSGDIGSNFESLAAHYNAQMQMSLSGIDYFGSDTGGFHREALHSDLGELYTKWLAHSSLLDIPVRPHTENGSRKNETSPDRIGDLKSNLANIRLRYELAPYYYSLAHRAFRQGEPVIPPLVYEFQEDPRVRLIGDEKMIGPELLVAIAPRAGEQTRDVYLPAGGWFNYRTLKFTPSTGEWLKNVSEESNGLFALPLFARAGAIIPLARIDDKSMNILGRRTDGSVRHDLTVRVFSGPKSSFTLYEDDGVSTRYQAGAVAETLLRQESSEGATRIVIEGTQGGYEGAPTRRRHQVELIRADGRKPARVTLNGSVLKHLSREDAESASGWWVDEKTGIAFARTGELPVGEGKSLSFEY